MKKKEQSYKLEAGNHSTQIIHTVNGLTYVDAKKIAQDTFFENFPRLTKIAREVAEARVDYLIELALNAIRKSESSFDCFGDPDFLFVLEEVQKQYARSGGDELGETLADLIADRAGSDSSQILTFVLNEALSIVPRLTDAQICSVAVIQSLLNVRFGERNHTHELSSDFLKIATFLETANMCTKAEFDYLEYMGVTSVDRIFKRNLIRKLHSSYFGEGNEKFTLEQFQNEVAADENLSKFLTWYDKMDVSQVSLTSVGQLIGLVKMKKLFPKLDYKVWIN